MLLDEAGGLPGRQPPEGVFEDIVKLAENGLDCLRVELTDLLPADLFQSRAGLHPAADPLPEKPLLFGAHGEIVTRRRRGFPADFPAGGIIMVNCQHGGSSHFLDRDPGVLTLRSEPPGTAHLEKLSPGAYQVTASKNGFRDATARVEVVPEKIARLEVLLSR